VSVDDASDRRVKNWNRLLSSNAPYQVESIRIIESNIFAPQTIEFHRAVAVVGLHGAGKTLLLRLLEAAFGVVDHHSYTQTLFAGDTVIEQSSHEDPVPPTGIIELSLRTPDGTVTREVDLSLPYERRREIWKNDIDHYHGTEEFYTFACYTGVIDAFADLSYLFQGGRWTENRANRNDDIIRLDLPKADLSALQYILGREYESFSVETDTIPEDWYPRFSGIWKGRNIDHFAMSAGEQWVHYVADWWLPTCLREDSLALIDEPEAFLAVRGQRPFIDQIAVRVLQKNLQLIIATHSPEILARFPLDNILMCSLDRRGILVRKPSSVQIKDILGMATPIRMLALVEDHAAKEMLLAILSTCDISLTRELDVVVVDGASEVENGVRVMRNSDRIKVIGILDGDEREKPQGRKRRQGQEKSKGSLFFLPGNFTPEAALLGVAHAEPKRLADYIGRSADDIIFAINSCQNLDHQHQMRYLAEHFALERSVLIFTLVRAWLRDSKIHEQAVELVAEIRSFLAARSN
jgi:hypothetical protein